jgi:putative ABC transport system permease protein
MARDAAAIRVYRGLLWLYPAEFREHFSQEICLLLADRLRAQGGEGSRLAVWLAAAGAVLIDAPKEHCYMIRQDVVYALRTMRRQKLTSLIAVVVLALGIGSTATIFKLANGLLLRPLPFPEQDRLVYVEESNNKAGGVSGAVAFPNYLDFCARNRSLDSFALYGSSAVTLRRQGADAERIPGGYGTGPLFRVLGVQPILGRTFTNEDDQPKAAPVVVLSEDLWRSRYGGDPAVLGKTILIGTMLGIRASQIIGVMPHGFRFPDAAQLWMPLQLSVKTNTRTDHWLEGIARLRRNVSLEQGRTDLRSIMQQISREHPTETYGQTVNAIPFQAQTSGDVRPALLTLLGAVGFVLLIACANISSLMLVRAATRQREIAVRGALGASRSRVVRQFVVESGLLGLAGAAGGILMSWAAVPALLRLTPAGTLPVWANFSMDVRTWIFILSVTAGTALLVGGLPALSASRLNLVDALKEGGRSSTTGVSGNRVRAILVAAEVAMSVLLLTGAGLMIRTLLNLERQNAGFRIDNITTLYTAAPTDRYPLGPPAEQLVNRIQREFASLPGVVSVAAASGVPLHNGWERSLTVEGAPLLSLRDAPLVNHTVVTTGYFKTLGIPILEGRDFNQSDTINFMVTIVDAGIARRYWPNQSAIGKRVRFGPPEDNEPWHVVVGVVGLARNEGIRELGRNTVYIPYQGKFDHTSLGWLVRTKDGLPDPGEALRRRVTQIDPNIAVSSVETMRHIVDDSVWQERFLATIFAVFAGLAMLMAVVGLYGVTAYTVSRRTHELGIRMALGASAGKIRAMVLLASVGLVGAGLAVGLAAAVLLTRLLEKELYGVKSTDPSTFVGVSALLVAAALLASYLPARRATRVDPMMALREE